MDLTDALWQPRGMPAAVSSSFGTDLFQAAERAEQDTKFRLAGDSLASWANARNAQESLARAEELRKQGGSGGSSGGSSGGGGLGSTIGAGVGLAAATLIPGAQPFAGPISALTSGIGGLFD